MILGIYNATVTAELFMVWGNHSIEKSARTAIKKNGEAGAVRFDGAVRTASGGPVSNSGFDVNRDDPAAQRMIDAHFALEDLIVEVSPRVWSCVLPAFLENVTAEAIGKLTGAVGRQASGVGTAFIKLVLEAALDVMARDHAERVRVSSLSLLQSRPGWAPVPARKRPSPMRSAARRASGRTWSCAACIPMS